MKNFLFSKLSICMTLFALLWTVSSKGAVLAERDAGEASFKGYPLSQSAFTGHFSWQNHEMQTSYFADNEYCHPVVVNGCSDGDAIDRFSLTHDTGTVNFETGCVAGAYSDLTDIVMDMTAGNTYTGSIGSDSFFIASASIWIDLNADGIFDEDELLTTILSVQEEDKEFNIAIPETAQGGLTRMRVGLGYINAPTDPCLWEYGQAIDYSINVNPHIGCIGTPDAGIISGPGEVCPESGFVLTSEWTEEEMEGISFQWQYAPIGTENWTDLIASFGPEYDLPNGISEETDFRLIVTCENSGESDVSNVLSVTFKPEEECYCIPFFLSSNDQIINFSIGDFSNDSTEEDSENGFSDFTHLDPIELRINTEYIASVTATGEGVHGISLWIDLNDDGVFSPSEILATANDAGDGMTVDLSPFMLTENVGLHRLRIIYEWDVLGEDIDPCAVGDWGEAEDYMVIILEELGPNPDCGQGDDSLNFESGFFIGDDDEGKTADDFFVTPGYILNVQQIEINVLSDTGVPSVMDFVFYQDEGGLPGEEPFMTVSDVTVESVVIGSGMGALVYAVFADVDISFTSGHYWMRPIVHDMNAWWEGTSEGSLGNPLATEFFDEGWTHNEEGAHGVFKLHCEPVTPPDPVCALSFSEVEPITRFIMADVDNSSAADSNEQIEDFTDIIINAKQGTSYQIFVEGNTMGLPENNLALFIDTSAEGEAEWSEYLTFPLESLSGSDGNDGVQSISIIYLPESLAIGDYKLRLIKTFDDVPNNPCGAYVWGQAEDYSINVSEKDEEDGCSQGIPSFETIPNAFNIAMTSSFRIAEDFTVEEGILFNMDRITIDVNNQLVPDEILIRIHKDENGLPGEVVYSYSGVPAESYVVGSSFGDPIHHLIFNLEEPAELEPGTYWLDPKMSTSDGQTVYWAATDEASHGASPLFSNNDGATWVDDGDGLSMIFTVSGNCDAMELNDELNSFDFAYYPNPVKDVLNINSSKKVESVKVYNLAGQLVMNNAKGLSTSNQIDVTRLPAGVYVFRAVLTDGQVETFKVIKR